MMMLVGFSLAMTMAVKTMLLPKGVMITTALVMLMLIRMS